MSRRTDPSSTTMGHRPRHAGFTLMEVMIVVFIIGILAAVAYPNYTEHVQRARRAEGKAALLKTQGALERYFTVNNTYTTNLALVRANAFSGDNPASSAYTIAVAPGPTGIASSYVITATPNANDPLCGRLTLDNVNTKGQERGTQAACW